MREKSCGTVTFTKIDGEIKYLLTRTDYGVYGFAKGHGEVLFEVLFMFCVPEF